MKRSICLLLRVHPKRRNVKSKSKKKTRSNLFFVSEAILLCSEYSDEEAVFNVVLMRKCSNCIVTVTAFKKIQILKKNFPQLSKERRRSEVLVPQLSKERRQSEVFVPQL